MIYLNNSPLSVTIFPDNTSQVWQLPEEQLTRYYSNIRWVYENEGEIVHLAQLKELLDVHKVNCGLWIDYLPYARQDKLVNNTSTFALRTFSKLLNSLNFEYIYISDPHSTAATNLIKNAIAYYPKESVSKLLKNESIDIICYPDAGATSKYWNIYPDFPSMYGVKTRDQLTGQITNYQLVGDCKDKNILIVDDICDGGATFKLLTKDLLTNGAHNVVLFVTHGIFSKGTKTLFESGINKIFTKNGEVF